MGMFDYIRFDGQEYQTKDTPNQLLDYYEIRGMFLYEETYDAKWIDEKEHLFGGYMEKYNEKWEKCENFTGEIRFYRHLDKEYKIWEEFSAYFIKGELKKLVKFEENEVRVFV